MVHAGELAAYLSTDALCRRVGSSQLGVLGLQVNQLVHEAIEIGIGNFGIVEDVVAVFVVTDLVAQDVEFLVKIFAGGHGIIMQLSVVSCQLRRAGFSLRHHPVAP
jgi:hypothetical protein